jgi:hypothetical protein
MPDHRAGTAAKGRRGWGVPQPQQRLPDRRTAWPAGPGAVRPLGAATRRLGRANRPRRLVRNGLAHAGAHGPCLVAASNGYPPGGMTGPAATPVRVHVSSGLDHPGGRDLAPCGAGADGRGGVGSSSLVRARSIATCARSTASSGSRPIQQRRALPWSTTSSKPTRLGLGLQGALSPSAHAVAQRNGRHSIAIELQNQLIPRRATRWR